MFVFKENGWWLKIKNLEELRDYYCKVEQKIMQDGFHNMLNSKEFGSRYSMKHANALGTSIGLYAVNRRLSPINALSELEASKFEAQVSMLENGFSLYFNRCGGWHWGNDDYINWCYKKELIFPEFDKEQISIKQFPLGTHYYAYIGGIQVRESDTIKWNTYEEAYNQALKMIN